MFLRYLILGVIFGFLGMIIESLDASVHEKRLAYRGDKYFINFPVKPIYALGGLILYAVVKLTKTDPWYLTIGLSTIAATSWEYFGGWFCVTILGERLWDYRDRKYQIHGHVSLWSIWWWVVFSAIFYFYLFDKFERLDSYLTIAIKVSPWVDMVFFVVFLIFISLATIIRKSTRKSVYKTK